MKRILITLACIMFLNGFTQAQQLETPAEVELARIRGVLIEQIARIDAVLGTNLDIFFRTAVFNTYNNGTQLALNSLIGGTSARLGLVVELLKDGRPVAQTKTIKGSEAKLGLGRDKDSIYAEFILYNFSKSEGPLNGHYQIRIYNDQKKSSYITSDLLVCTSATSCNE